MRAREMALVEVPVTGCGGSGKASQQQQKGRPGENASSDNTPRVGPKGTVEVGTLRWKLDKAKTAKASGDQECESVTLTSETISLVAGEKVCKPDGSAEAALIGSGGKTFLLEDLGPGVTLNGRVAFDVQPSVLKQHPELRFDELGFGETHGYIALPKLSG